jgi:hypothetical protein
MGGRGVNAVDGAIAENGGGIDGNFVAVRNACGFAVERISELDTLRQAKSKASQDLTVARDALRAVLTVRQEAVLVDRGILD